MTSRASHRLFLLSALLPLGGCFGLFGGENAQYSLAYPSAESDPDTQTYLEEILADRLAEPLPGGDTREDAERRETYRELSIRRDLIKALRAKGYYDARVRYQDDPQAPLTGRYFITPGERYRIAGIALDGGDYEAYRGQLSVGDGDILDAAAVLQSQQALYTALQKDHCAYSLTVENAVVLNRQAKTADVSLQIAMGPEAKFGDIIFTGDDGVRASHLRKLVPWKKGACFRHDQIETYRTRLLESGLFSRADAILPAAPDADGSVPVTITLKERAHRTLRAGLNYYTDTGPGALFGWEHRNILGAAEKLAVDLTVSQLEQSLKSNFSKPFFIRDDQNLSLSASITREDTDAYEEIGFGFGGDITRKFTPQLSGSIGADFKLTRISEDAGPENTYGLLSVPATLTYDTRDNSLDPRAGWFLNGRIKPFFDALGESDPFVKMELSGSTYVDMGAAPDLVLALRGHIGSIAGAATDNIPATERFYAGGGGSVRGFGHQEVGPKRAGDPVGGRSIVTGAAELRYKLTEKFGMVSFVDAGSVSDATAPEFETLAVGAGLGIRYYTGFGPLRFDVAVPLTQKDDLDQNYQIYISIGQAF